MCRPKDERSHGTSYVDAKLVNNGSIDPCGASQGKEHGTGKNGMSEQSMDTRPKRTHTPVLLKLETMDCIVYCGLLPITVVTI